MQFFKTIITVFMNVPIYGKITIMLFLCILAFSGPVFYAFDSAQILRVKLEEMTKVKMPVYKSGQLLLVELEHIRDTFHNAITPEDLAHVRLHLQLVSHDIEIARRIVDALLNRGRVTDKYTGEVMQVRKTIYDPDSLQAIELLLAGMGDEVSAIQAEYAEQGNLGEPRENGLVPRLQALSEKAEKAFQLNVSLASHSVVWSQGGFVSMMASLKTKMKIAFAFVLAMVLLIAVASYVWGISLVKPLRVILLALGDIRYPGSEWLANGVRKSIPALGNDEIGQIAHAMNSLVEHNHGLSSFRRTIEADVTPEEIYIRLAKIFRENLNFTSFVIYITDEDADAMIPAYIWPSEMIEELYSIEPASFCRAKRTGVAVDSLHHEGICATFPWSDALTHACIPLVIGEEIIGVVQFLFPFVYSPERETRYHQALNDARQYLNEAIPVLQAKLLNKKLKELATRDSLTGLYNRHHLEETLPTVAAMAGRRSTRLGILMCDLDFFKKINDQHGHDAGDLVLKETARILRQCIRKSDMAVRYGGEEFLVVLTDCHEGMAEIIAEKIHTAVKARSFMVNGVEIMATVSIGVAEFPADNASARQAITCADKALYQAKKCGRDQVVRFTPELS